MDDFFLLVGGLIFFSWVLAYILKSIIKAPSKIAYHLTGQAEIDRQAAAEAKVKRAEEKIEFEKQESERLKQAVRQLPEERQQLLLLKFVHHLSNAEIGEIMGKTEGAIKSLYHRTLLVLRDQLAEETPESERLAN